MGLRQWRHGAPGRGLQLIDPADSLSIWHRFDPRKLKVIFQYGSWLYAISGHAAIKLSFYISLRLPLRR